MMIIKNIVALVALLFGLITIIAGTRVLLGSDPGYIVFRPLLIFNVVMGIVYLSAGVIGFRNVKRGMYLSAVIFILNLIVLSVILYWFTETSSIAIESLHAMTLRTSIWLTILVGFGWINYRKKDHAL